MFERKKFEEDKPKFSLIERLIGKTDSTTGRNAYLHRHLSAEQKELLKGDKLILINKIESILADRQKSPLRKELARYSFIEYDVEKFTNSQLIRILVILEGLTKQENIDSLGKQIENDLQDENEHGGIVVFDEQNGIIFDEVPDDNPSSNAYGLPDIVRRKVKYIAAYHLHATQDDCSEFVGPSPGGSLIEGVAGDVTNSRTNSRNHGSHHGIVITKLAGDKFNVVYYSTVGKDKKIQNTVVYNLGDFEYNR